MAEANRFSKGDQIRLKIDTSRSGIIIGVLPSVGGVDRFLVFHGAGDSAEYLASQIELTDSADNEFKPICPDEFLIRLNCFKLKRPQVDSLYGLYSARIKFIPFQFKPVLRLLRAERPRILIADEVGVGKTIESGLILKELQAREELRNIVIVCPSALCAKWRTEMKRFDEDFFILSAEHLTYCLNETEREGSWPARYSRAIISLELARMSKYLDGPQNGRRSAGFNTLSIPPSFDLAIFDEAHHLRTRETKSHELARYFADNSRAMLLISATPIQLGSDNLFTLLNLLKPEEFYDRNGFLDLIEPNKHINLAIRHLRNSAGNGEALTNAGEALFRAAETPWGRKVLMENPDFMSNLNIIRRGGTLSDKERVRLIRDIEDSNTLAHIINRTKRRDIGKFTLREPITVSARFTASQREFYDRLIDFQRELKLYLHDPFVVALIIDSLERQAASCLPVMKKNLENFITRGLSSLEELSDDPENDSGARTEDGFPEPLIERIEALRRAAGEMTSEDPKYQELLKIVREAMASGSGKVLLFSFFINTLSYLNSLLAQCGLRTAMICGKTPDEEREELRNRFRLDREDPLAIDILLSSEVGCEGLDYEFCSNLVNYDIPWNPMRIEQRIGRIDRFGQKSPVVKIFNFITPGTVEERIFFRCFERLGVFSDTIGDLEEVLGQITGTLSRAALSPELTAAQSEEIARQAADNVLREIEENRRLEESGTDLAGFDGLFTEEVESVRKNGKFISSADIKFITEKYLAAVCGEFEMRPCEEDDLFRLVISKKSRERLMMEIKKMKRKDKNTVEIVKWLEGTSNSVQVTFDQKAASEKRSSIFITPIHPLVKAAASYFDRPGQALFTCVECDKNILDPGTYSFAYYLWEEKAYRSFVKTVLLIKNENSEKIIELPQNLLSEIMSESDLSESLLKEAPETSFQKLDEQFYIERSVNLEKLKVKNENVIRRRLAGVVNYHEKKIRCLTAEIAAVRDERILRMKRAEIERAERELHEKTSELEAMLTKTDILTTRIAFGKILIKNNK